MESKKPVALIILDGWGIREFTHGNAVAQAHTPNYDRWLRTYERSILDASGRAVGLPDGQMGNSEVGHLNLGAGRIVYQDIVRIDVAIEDGSFFKLKALNKALDGLKERGNDLHLIGLLGPGGVHSHLRHHKALLKLAQERGLTPVLHIITDGRDTPPESAAGFLADLEAYIAREEIDASIASLSGRYYAMDRDKRWQRTQRAYDVMTQGGSGPESTIEAIKASYAAGTADEFIEPTRIGHNRPAIKDGDVLVFFNFRADRMRQIVRAFAYPDFDGFERGYKPADLQIFTVTPYEKDFPVNVLFEKKDVTLPLAEVLSKAGKKQFHTAETEKYPHVTYFFNGGREQVFDGEERYVEPSPKVPTYDLQPEMSAYQLTDHLVKRILEGEDDFILINYANPDMVGHTGSLEAAVRACEAVDQCAGRIVNLIVAKGGVAFVTADHGNCEIMVDEVSREPHTYHTTNPVSFIAVSRDYIRLAPRGKLADVAPTVLAVLGVAQPEEMDGVSLLDMP